MDKKKSIKIVKEFTKKVREDFEIYSVIFFGSRAKGNQKKESDIDVIIVSDDFKGLSFSQRGSKMYNYWDYLIPVDFICLTIDEYNKLKDKITIVGRAIKEGILFN